MPDPTPTRFALKSTRVITPEGEIAAAIIVDGKQIEGIVSHSELPADILCDDYGDFVISPGVIDAHVHINEPGRTQWEGFSTATSAAAAGGVTTLIDMPLNSSPVTTSVSALETKRKAACGKCIVNVEFYGGLVPGNETEIPRLIAAGVKGVKAFLCDSGLDEFPAAGEKELRAALPMLKEAGVPLLAHAEIVSADGVATGPETFSNSPQQSYAAYMNSRPASFEVTAIKLLIDLCREFQSPIHIVHLATAEALPMIAAAKDEGLLLTVETCPHYLYFCDQEIDDGQTQFKCAPPIRDAANRTALRSAVASGLIDTIGSDHSPCPPEMKQMLAGDFGKAWGGIASLQLTLPIMATIAEEEDWPVTKLASLLSQHPAETFGFGDSKGRIAAGYDADLVIWDPTATFTVAGEQLEHRHSITPYENRKLSGQVMKTYVAGEVVFEFDAAGDDEVPIELSLADWLNSFTQGNFLETLQTCCASSRWCKEMDKARPFDDDDDVQKKAVQIWNGLDEADWLEAFEGHPQIGNVETLRAKFANTKQIAGNEQASVQSASEKVLSRLATANQEYLAKFGFIFIVFATGKSADQMLGLLEERLPRDRQQELNTAAQEQSKITSLRLKKLVTNQTQES